MRYFLAAIGGATAIMLLFYFADQGVLRIIVIWTKYRTVLRQISG
jgi:hypothetical protein